MNEPIDNPATNIMADPAQASGTAPAPLIPAPEGSPPEVQKLLNDMPGLIGALNEAITAIVGKPLPVALLIFHPKGALHASNMLAEDAARAVIEYGRVIAQHAQETDADAGGGAANDAGGSGAPH